jgi:PAS domain S-box-containing protein
MAPIPTALPVPTQLAHFPITAPAPASLSANRQRSSPVVWHWRHWLAAFLPFCCSLLLAAAANAATAEPLRFFGDRNLPPYEFIEDDMPKGANVELAQAIGRVLGRPVEVQLVDWGQAQSRLLAGEGNALTFLGRTEQREAQYVFSQPTLPVAFALFVRTGQEQQFDQQNLQGKRIGVIKGSLPYQYFSEKQPQTTLVVVDNAIDGTTRLLRGDIDALAANAWSELYLLKQLHISGVAGLAPFSQRKGNIALRKADLALRGQIDSALGQLQASGEFDRIIDRWSSEKVHLFSDATVRAAEIAGGVAALALLLLGAALVMLYRKHAALRLEIGKRQRTAQQLHDSEQRLQLFIEHAPASLAMFDRDMRYLSASRRWRQELKLDDSPLAGRLHYEVCPDLPEKWKAAHQRGLAGQVVSVDEDRFPRADGSVLWRQWEIRPWQMADGEIGGIMIFAIDITRRKQAEQEREQLLAEIVRQKTFLECLMANAHSCIAVMCGPELRYTFVNPAYEALVSKASILGCCFRDIFPEAVQAGLEQQLLRVRETGRPWLVESYAAPIPGKPQAFWEGQVVRMPTAEDESAILVIVWDVTERVKAEQARQASAATLQAVLNATQESIWLFNKDGIALMANQIAVSRWDKTADEMIGQSVHAFLPADLANSRLAKLHAVVATGQPLDFEDQRAGTIFHHRFYPVFDAEGRVANIASFSRDITPFRQAAQALQQSQERLRLAQQIGQIATFEVDLIARVSRWTPEFEALYGMPPGSFGDSHQAWRDRVHPDDLAELDRLTKITRETGDFYAEWRTTWPDGSLHWLAGRAKLYTDATGRPIRLLGVNIDITKRKLAELALEAAVEVAEQANNAKSRFLAAASHDLRQPLSALSMYVGVLKSRLGPEHAALFGNMKNCLASLNELLTDLLDLSKLEAGVVTPTVSEFAVADLLARVCAAHKPEAQLKQLRLKWIASDRIGRSDPVLYVRLLGNLVSNAVRYTEHGGVLVGCRRRQGKMWVEVWDSGIGIPADKTVEIFDEFKQLGDGARTRGSGLGLAIVAKTADLLGLQLRVRSQPGRGSLFAVELPLGSRVEASPPTAPLRRPLRIALAEDNAAVAEALQSALAEYGHQVIAAANSAQLLARLQQLPPDIVISDYRLAGGETGFEVITAAREAFGTRLPALIVTGDTDPALIRSMASKGVRVQHKPLELEALQACITEIVRPAPDAATTMSTSLPE